MRLAALLALLLAWPPWGNGGGWNPLSPWHGPSARQPVTVYDRVFTSSVAHPGTLPTCPGGSVALQCTMTTGGAISCNLPTTAGTGAIGYTDPLGVAALDDVTATRAPHLTTATALDATLGAAHTIIFTGYSTPNTSVTDTILEANAGSNTVQMRSENTTETLACNYGTKQARANASSAVAFGSGWNFGACGYDGSSTVRSWLADGSGVSSSTGTYAAPTSTALNLGRNNGGTSALRGAAESFTVCAGVELSTSNLATQAHAWEGIPDDSTNPISFTRAGSSWFIVNGRAEPFGVGVPYVSARGLEFWPGNDENAPSGNGWSTDSTDATTDTAVGTPTITANQAADPYAAWRVGTGNNDMDLIVDDDAAAFEGTKGSLSAVDTPGNIPTSDDNRVTCGCWVAAGTSGTTRNKVRIGVLTDGTGSATCDYSDLTSTPALKTCTATITGSPTTCNGEALVGNAASDTGSIIRGACGCYPRGYLPTLPPCQVAGTCPQGPADDVKIPVATTSTWPTGQTQGGDLTIWFTPNFDYPSAWHQAVMVFDSEIPAAGPGHSIAIYISSTDGGATAQVRAQITPSTDVGGNCPVGSGSDNGQTNGNVNVTLTKGTQYAVRLKWLPAGTKNGQARVNTFLYLNAAPTTSTEATTPVGSDTSGNKCATDSSAILDGHLGRRYNDLRTFDGAYARARARKVWQ